ncbi:hypothetical protein [Ammoniphilus resinae]|uniref:Uncharacterized protein n=1 Tax=Ammoniphilus resinae TaxID=861532 RepID=A0ABS4GUN2_9BACL|nr:hypothetical protein [Ammoniphilus resinae]MBP1933954.1 hypothetical protein [Ammoniphilus resinae]
MEWFEMEIESLRDIGLLQEKKKQIKDSVINPDLNWNSRMELYKQVQLINMRIEKLSYRATSC